MRTVFKLAEIPGRIHAMQPFLSEGKLPDGTRRWAGYKRSDLPRDLGYLPPRLHGSVRSAVYVVFSYGTPVGWVTETEDSSDPYWFHVPDISYSITTGTHQMACVEAWAAAMKRQHTYRRFPASHREVVRVPGMTDTYGGRPGARSRTLHPRSGGIDGPVSRPTADEVDRRTYQSILGRGLGPEPPAEGTLPYDPHDYDYPGGDHMRWKEQDALIEEVQGWRPQHP